ncbi:amino acid ABC transporter ATP-binding protein [Natroniella sulfidigena]|uniref:amino acid ABC transporter ATP-binding protein n=1 Tax=Natroniella sulfidigena TaxID=723921 RepID=UPI00200A7AB6|nr:amino acid ABC transporter ATP-binding protein [Natroniella sulfidigena]MCK8816360.1 amino acid ABC transporter ATP-binding protein [Natroniella sulfidigena]
MLQVSNLTKSYGSTQVLTGVDFKVKQGETVAIMGPSGCGKSTTIRCINRLTEPDGGEIIFKGVSVLDLSEDKLLSLRKEIGFVFQKFNLIERLTVLENIILPVVKTEAKACQQELEQKALQILEKVKLADKATSAIDQLSGGQKQRVGIARALIIDPSLLLLDEPTASLDPILVREVLEVIEELTALQDKAIIIVTHEVSFALQVADLILLMDQGQIVEQGSPDEIFVAPQSEVGQKYKDLLEYY